MQATSKNILDALDPYTLARELKAARVRSGLTQEQAAGLIGVGRTTIVAIEQGTRRVTPQELVRLAHGYGREIGDFVRERPQVEEFKPQFRGPTEPTTEDQTRIRQQVQTFEDLCRAYLELEELTGSPLVRHYPPEYTTSGLPVEQAAETIALEERNRLRLGDGPVPLLRDILEHDVGLRVFYLELPSRYSEIYVYTEQLGGCLAINRSHPVGRRNWSSAHGYFHFLAHRRQAVVEANGAYHRQPEHDRMADAFARFFLMPTTGLVRRFNEIRQSKGKVTLVDFAVLAHYYGVSVPALVYRLEDLRLVSVGTWDELKRNGVKDRDLQARAGVGAYPDRDDRYPLRYQLLAVEALDRELISEGRFARFLDLPRIESRRQAALLRDRGDQQDLALGNHDLGAGSASPGALGKEDE